MAISPLPTPLPSRQQPEATFATNADSFLGALPTFVTEANALQADVNAKQTTASAAATTASEKAAEATASAATAQTLAAYKGLWSGLTGALAIPASVRHDDKNWMLIAGIADVTAHEPGVSTSWAEIKYGEGGYPEFIASGNIDKGKTVILNSDGTVTLVTGENRVLGIATVFESASTGYISCCYDSTNGKIVIAYRDVGNSDYGTAVVFEKVGSTNNANFIGVAQDGAASGAAVPVAVAYSTDVTQTGLTPKSTYYANGDGTLTTTSGGDKVLVGVALAENVLRITGGI